MSIDLSQFIPTFLEESFEGLEVMESGLLNLDANDSEQINAIFRAAHSIKGGAGTFGFGHITEFTHVVETLLDEVRGGDRAFTPSLQSLLLQSVDCIRMLLEAARDGVECESDQIGTVHQELVAELEGGAPAPATDTPQAHPADTGAQQQKGWLIHFVPEPHLLMTGNEPILMMSALAELGDTELSVLEDKLPEFSELNPEELHLAWQVQLFSDCSEADVREVFEWVEDDCELTITPLMDTAVESAPAEEPAPQVDTPVEQPTAAETPAPTTQETPKTAAKPAARKASQEAGSIRVGIDKIDGLINRVGELVITQSMLSQAGSELAEQDLPAVERLHEGLVQLERNTRDLQEEVMRIRMLPISFVFNRFPRMVHDVSAKLNKQVELKLSGEQTELDKTVMEKIGDPLVHLVRNSLDHGLEPPEERLAAGKDETGIVHLNAYHQGGYIVIEIKDDGRGLNTERIREKALENGLISPDQPLAESEIHELIFRAGFSTAAEVSDLSGRGVGMDVVRKNIESLGGHVSVQSETGKGSTFTVSLPLTLAILDGQLVQINDEVYIVPLVSVVESIQVADSELQGIAGEGRLFRFRDEYIPIIHLRRVFDVASSAATASTSLMVVVEGGGMKVGLIVDDLQGQQQVVIKSLETNYKRVDGISGATILGDGDVALILDVAGLIKIGLEPTTKHELHRKNEQLQVEEEALA
ncbi:chemotaxis protein CheA [Neptunomonas marina]|uniref:Chemotaxis protein CheA n=1 Tax=Neptunomonas marina TaxID=1815562 RepID=A0A437Q6D1_9GAMM|nr:chemotaxis protein CheA [Neptunomonas marina]RVU30070.1 chemotaxis protein CheA [Neptunomonas marina]